MTLRIKNNRITLNSIAYLQIIGGIIGIGVWVSFLLNIDTLNGPGLLLLLIALAFFIFSTYTGKILLDERKVKYGIILSMINFGLQLVQIQIDGYGLSYISGVEVLIGYGDGIEAKFAILKSSFNLYLNSTGDEIFVLVNLWALLLMYVLADIWDELKAYEEKKVGSKETMGIEIKS
jgi:hypothetical protein